MKSILKCFISCVFIVLICGFTSKAQEDSPVPFIVDTDFSSDVDDALALSVACYYQDAGLIDIRGVALCCTSTNGAYGVSALLQQHGLYNIPICADWDDGVPISSKYQRALMAFGYNDVYYSDVVSFYRMLLASSDEKITIVTLGQLTNIYLLLESEPDVYSPLTGAELVAEKVEHIYCVAGKSNGGLENNIWYSGEDMGYNRWLGNGASVAAKYVADYCPVPITWMETDLIGGFTVGEFLCKSDKSDILSQALIAYGTEWGSYSFDPFGVMIAALDSNDMLDTISIEVVPGRMNINLTGTSYFIDYEQGNHYRIQKLNTDNYYKWLINEALQYEFDKRFRKGV